MMQMASWGAAVYAWGGAYSLRMRLSHHVGEDEVLDTGITLYVIVEGEDRLRLLVGGSRLLDDLTVPEGIVR